MTETLVMTPDRTAAAGPRPTPRFLRRALLDSAYAVTAFPLALLALVPVVAGVAAGAGTLVVAGVGLLVLVGTTYVARGFAHVERQRLVWTERYGVVHPVYLRPDPRDATIRRVLTPLRDVQSWLDVLWCLVGLVTATVAFAITVAWYAAALGGLSYWFWQRFIPYDPDDNVTLSGLVGLGEGRTAESLLLLAIGFVALLSLPLAVRVAAGGHAAVSHALLCSRARMVGQLVRAEHLRETAHRAEAASLRKLERDIHDGPQQRLIRLGMDLGRARRQIDQDPATAADTLDAALGQARAAVEELRALSRGIAPPLLVDRGLAVAVREMADGQSIPVRVVADVPPRMEEAVETAAYFVVAEALSNVAKHSGADRADVALRVEEDRLVVTVDDDGRGGARVAPAHGLSGLEERVAALGGRLLVASPDGGPTRLRAEVPLR